MPQIQPTQIQLDRIAEAARLAAKMRINLVNPLQCPVAAELIDARIVDALAVIEHWENSYNFEKIRRVKTSIGKSN
jgi:hypothetical protein